VSDCAEGKNLPPTSKGRNDTLIIILSVSCVLGMAIAVRLIFVWRSYPAVIAQSAAWHAAVALCPPFILVGVVGGVSDTALTLVLTAGTIVFANASLYAGLAAFGYWVLTTFWPRHELR
jgi:hypothetical protein